MASFKFFALGGLGEVGKNMYVLEINEDIFVLDTGSATPTSQVYGYDSVIPDFKYLIENKDRIKGIFLSHFKQKATGGFLRIVKDIKAPFFASKFTIEAIKTRYISQLNDEEKEGINFVEIRGGQTIDLNDMSFTFFNVASSVPDTLGVSFRTLIKDEYRNIVYLPDFNFDQNVEPHFRTDFKTINKIAKDGVIALLSPSTGAFKNGHSTTDGKLDSVLHKLMAHEGRTYLLMDGENISGILQVLDAVDFQKRRCTIIGQKARSLVELSMKLGYCKDYHDSYLPKTALNDENRNDPNTVIIIAGEQTEEYFALQRIASYQDPHYILKPTDNVAFLVNTPKKFEKILANCWDFIWMNNANLIEFDNKLMPDAVCCSEDLKLLYALLSPMFIVPISGDYRMLKAQRSIAKDFGYDDEHIIDIDNGLIAKVSEDGELINEIDGIETGDILFGEESDTDINDYVAREREALTQEGFIIMSGMISLKTRELIGEVKVVSSGFLPEFGQEETIDLLKKKFAAIVDNHLCDKKVDYKELRLDLKNELSKYILKETKKKPVLVPVIIDVTQYA